MLGCRTLHNSVVGMKPNLRCYFVALVVGVLDVSFRTSCDSLGLFIRFVVRVGLN